MSERPALQAFDLRRCAYGIALALGLAGTARFAADSFCTWQPEGSTTPVSSVFCAIVLGMLWRQGFGLSIRAEQGVQLIMRTLLPAGIALVGLRLTLDGIVEIGAPATTVVIGCVLVALAVSAAVGRSLGISRALQCLIAMGTAVCGCTAIVAVAPIVRARPEEMGVALTCIVLFGGLGMLIYPWLAHALFPANSQAAGIFLGTSIHDTSQVIGASLMYGQQFNAMDTVAAAGVTKLLRNTCLLILIPLAARWSDAPDGSSSATRPSRQLTEILPGFLMGFLLFAFVRTVGDRLLRDSPGIEVGWQRGVEFGLWTSELLLVCGMAAVGLSTSLKAVTKIGWRAPATALVVAICVVFASAVLTWLGQRV